VIWAEDIATWFLRLTRRKSAQPHSFMENTTQTRLDIYQKGFRMPLESAQIWKSGHGSTSQVSAEGLQSPYQRHIPPLSTNDFQIYAEIKLLVYHSRFLPDRLQGLSSAFRVYNNSLGMPKRQQPSMAQSKLWKTCAV
jgi:hypothetical protein